MIIILIIQREHMCDKHAFMDKYGTDRQLMKKLTMKQFCNTKSVDMPYIVCDNESHTK